MFTQILEILFRLGEKKLMSEKERIDWGHFTATIAIAATVALPLFVLEYALTSPYPVNPITRIVLEGFSFLAIYVVSLRLLKIVQREDFEILRKALLHRLDKIMSALEGFITQKA